MRCTWNDCTGKQRLIGLPKLSLPSCATISLRLTVGRNSRPLERGNNTLRSGVRHLVGADPRRHRRRRLCVSSVAISSSLAPALLVTRLAHRPQLSRLVQLGLAALVVVIKRDKSVGE